MGSFYSQNTIRTIIKKHVIVPFFYLDLSYLDITDESISKLINCHTLNLSRTNVTDESVSKLINCHTLDLSGTQVTDECMNELRINNVICDK